MSATPRASDVRSALGRIALGTCLVAAAGCHGAAAPVLPTAGAAHAWQDLFDGASLQGWQPSGFGGDGEVAVQDGAIVLGMGSPLTGLTRTEVPFGPQYELEVVAARLLGNDFFAAVTFPVGEQHLTLVLGGWGGTVCGFSNLDGLDANHNQTRSLRSFERGRDYRIRVAVDAGMVTAWLDDQELCRTPRAGVAIGLRNEMLVSTPLGISNFATEARVRSVRWRPLP